MAENLTIDEVRERAKALEEWFKSHDETDQHWCDNRRTYQEYSNLLLNANTKEHAGSN